MRTLTDTHAGTVTAAVALLVVASGIGNGFAYDDVGLLLSDARLHTIASLPHRVVEPWWGTGLFRPLTLAWLGVQWVLGSGSPVVFHLVSSLLYAAVCVVVYLLARTVGITRGPSLIATTLFAVHPVHSEVTANVVGQAELLSALFAILTVVWYVHARHAPRFGRRDILAVTGLFLLSAHAKEGGYVVPGLLVAAELLLVRDPRSLRKRWGALREPALFLTAAFLATLWLRQSVLGGLGGETPHIALRDLSIWERGVAMLAVVPEWARLLIWPARLQAEYGPPGLEAVPAIGWAHLLGLAVVVGVALAIMGTWRRQPIIAFGLLWSVIALAPVANVVFPTGILLAERTLFLPSVGGGVALAGVLMAAAPVLDRRPALRWGGLGVLGVLVLASGVHSARRQPLWRDTLTILERTSRDAAQSYRAQYVYGRELQHVGRLAEAEEAYRRATVLWERDPRPFEELGQLLRTQGDCARAIPVLEGGVMADSTSDTARSRLIECLIVEQRWDDAEREIERGLAQGVEGYSGTQRRINTVRSWTP